MSSNISCRKLLTVFLECCTTNEANSFLIDWLIRVLWRRRKNCSRSVPSVVSVLVDTILQKSGIKSCWYQLTFEPLNKGFSSLRKKYLRYSKHKLSLVDKVSGNSENHNFIQKYDRWYKIQDRGGLQKPCDTFFLLVRELELVVRKSVTAKLGGNSLLLGPLKENIMESFMVKYYCDMLIPNECYWNGTISFLIWSLTARG
jgi:hypothetical protein